MLSLLGKKSAYFKPSSRLAGLYRLNAHVGKKVQIKNFDPFSDEHFKQLYKKNAKYYLYNKDVKEVTSEVSRSVGAIIATNGDVHADMTFEGTCFRIGNKYVITNLHVWLNIRNKGYKVDHVDFNYKEEKSWPCRFDKKPLLVHGTAEGLDYAILTLLVEDDKPFPPNIFEDGYSVAMPECFNDPEQCLTIIAHPDGNRKMIDTGCPFVEPSTKDWLSSYFHNRRRDMKAFVQYHPKICFSGSSGSPGLLMSLKKVALLHSRGYKEDNFWFVEGIMISAIIEDVKNKIKNGSLMLDEGVTLPDIFEFKFPIQENGCGPLSENIAVVGDQQLRLGEVPMELDN